MKTYTVLISALTMIVFCKSDDATQAKKEAGLDIDKANFTEAIEMAILDVENNAEAVEKLSKEETHDTDEIENHYENMADTFKVLIKQLRTPEHANEFLNAKGVDRIITPIVDVNYSKLRGLILTALKTLFEVAPSTTSRKIPATTIDKLLDIFENDDNLAMKAHSLDILYIWLPENPRIQVRVMKLKGLEPFYQQVTKLDTSVISKLLDLFNKILIEHMKVRSDRSPENNMDSNKIILYNRIGLIERMSTPSVCNGLLNIFDTILSYSNDDNDVIVPVFELIKNTKPYCTKVFQGKNSAIKLFEALLKYVEDKSKKEHFDSLKLNLTDIDLVLKDIIKVLKQQPVKDEF